MSHNKNSHRLGGKLAWTTNPKVHCVIINFRLGVNFQGLQIRKKIFLQIDAPPRSKIVLQVKDITVFVKVTIAAEPHCTIRTSKVL